MYKNSVTFSAIYISDLTHSFPNPKILDHTSYFSFPGILSVKKSHLDMRHRAILNQAFCSSNGKTTHYEKLL